MGDDADEDGDLNNAVANRRFSYPRGPQGEGLRPGTPRPGRSPVGGIQLPATEQRPSTGGDGIRESKGPDDDFDRELTPRRTSTNPYLEGNDQILHLMKQLEEKDELLKEKSLEAETAKQARNRISADLRGTISKRDADTCRLTEQFKRREDEIRRSLHSQLQDQLVTEEQRLRQKREQNLRGFNAKVESLKGEYDKRFQALEKQKAELVKQIDQMAAVHSKTLDSLETIHRQDVEKLHAERDRLINDHARAIRAMEQNRKALPVQHTFKSMGIESSTEEQIKVLVEERTAEKTEQIKSLISAMGRMKTKHSEEMQIVRDACGVKDLNEALLTRDIEMYQGRVFAANEIPGNIDRQWSEVRQIVDELGRVPWKRKPKSWAQSAFASTAQSTQRLLKKAIIQDIVWSTLFVRVFCSPFRMFGDEGLKLEREWIGQCGQTGGTQQRGTIFVWPRPGFKTERWRYMTMNGCSEALGPPVPSQLDARARVVAGFSKCLRHLVQELKEFLGEVIEVETPGNLAMIQNVAINASDVWLRSCEHRCRFEVRLTGSGPEAIPTAERIAADAAKGETVALTVMPEVGRHGNMKGAELETYNVLSGLEGAGMGIELAVERTAESMSKG